MIIRPTPTEEQLREAYRRARLADTGVTFEAAMQAPAIRRALHLMAGPDKQWAAKNLGGGSRRLELLTKDSK